MTSYTTLPVAIVRPVAERMRDTMTAMRNSAVANLKSSRAARLAKMTRMQKFWFGDDVDDFRKFQAEMIGYNTIGAACSLLALCDIAGPTGIVQVCHEHASHMRGFMKEAT